MKIKSTLTNDALLREIKNFKKKIEHYDYGKIGNSILYEMCAKYPFHKDESEIIAKVWLIGRSYAAQIERNRNNKNISDDFYNDKVGPTFKKGFDDILKEVRGLSGNKINSETIPVILATHKKVIDFIRKITKDNKRSFASKYLHFHFRNLFFIYDSRVAGAIKKVTDKLSTDDKSLLKIYKNKFDRNYGEFFLRCLHLYNFCKENGMNMSLRDIDSFLIKRANRKIIEDGKKLRSKSL